MVKLFQKDGKTITEHIQNVFKEGDLAENSVCRKFQHTASDDKKYDVNFFNLDVIISVGYRVTSLRGTQFRIWGTQGVLVSSKKKIIHPRRTRLASLAEAGMI